MKKNFLSLLIVFFTMSVTSLPLICFSEQPDPKEWEHLSDNFYYNKTNLIKSSDTISVWTYRTIADDERKYLIEYFRESDLEKSKKYQNLDHQTMLLNIDCRKKLSKIEKLVNYDYKENVLYEETYKNSEWKSIIPESKLDETYNKICVTPEKKDETTALRNTCEKQCEEWVKADERKFFRDKFTHQNHYNTRLDKCFILLQYTKKQSKILKNIIENKIYGSFRSKQDGKIIICNVLEKTCKSEEEWDSLVKPYMEE
jgi:hypothetical protein